MMKRTSKFQLHKFFIHFFLIRYKFFYNWLICIFTVPLFIIQLRKFPVIQLVSWEGNLFWQSSLISIWILVSAWDLCPLWKCSLVIIKADNTASCNLEDIYRKTRRYWTTSAVNRVFIIIDSRSNCGTCKNTWHKYRKIKIAWYLVVYEISDLI